jgi:prevent-host-death family protein
MTPRRIGSFEAKTRLSAVLERVSKGQVYIITKRGRPVAELRPLRGEEKLQFGRDRGRIRIAADFDAPLPHFKKYTR